MGNWNICIIYVGNKLYKCNVGFRKIRIGGIYINLELLYRETTKTYLRWKTSKLLLYGLVGGTTFPLIIGLLIRVIDNTIELSSIEWLLLMIQAPISVTLFLLFIREILRKPLKVSADHIELPYPRLISLNMKRILLRKIYHENISTITMIKHGSWKNKNNQETILWELDITLRNGRKIKVRPLNLEMMKTRAVKAIEQFKQQFALKHSEFV